MSTRMLLLISALITSVLGDDDDDSKDNNWNHYNYNYNNNNYNNNDNNNKPPEPFDKTAGKLISDILGNLSKMPPEGQFLSGKDINNLKRAENLTQSILSSVPRMTQNDPGNDPYSPYPPPPKPNPPPFYDPYPNESGNWNKGKKSNALQLGLGIGLGVPLCLAVLGCFIFLCYRSRRRRSNNGMFPMPLPKSNMYVQQNDSPNKPTFDPWELPRNQLSINYDKKLGSGAFCNVFKGKIIGDAPVSNVFPGVRTMSLTNCDAAVKMLPSFADDIARSDFVQEINFMKSLAYHPHLVSMLGFVEDRKSPLLLVEFCERGDLLHFIREKRQEIQEGPLHPDGLKVKDLLGYSWQISNGLEYLNSVGCIHRDIAARNVLVDGQLQCKIGDFGLCRLTDSLLYTARGGRLPLKWMAPESLETYEYSFKSDVWSYGVLLWELFSLGDVPFNLVQTSDLLEYLQQGGRLEQPELCTDEIFSVMSDCWKYESRERPAFYQISARLASMLEMATENYGYLVPRHATENTTVQCDDV